MRFCSVSSPIFWRGVQRLLGVALFQKALLGGEMRPHAGEAVGLQFDPHRHLVGLGLAHALPHLIELRQDADQVLDMMADLVGDHIGLREVAGGAELPVELLEEGGVEIDLAIEQDNRTGPEADEA